MELSISEVELCPMQIHKFDVDQELRQVSFGSKRMLRMQLANPYIKTEWVLENT